MCRPRSRPIVLIRVAESAATGRPSIRTFQTLVAGKTGQFGAPGRVGAPPGGRRRRGHRGGRGRRRGGWGRGGRRGRRRRWTGRRNWRRRWTGRRRGARRRRGRRGGRRARSGRRRGLRLRARPARGRQRARAGAVLDAVGEPVAIRVGDPRLRPQPLLRSVGQPIPVRVLAAVPQAVAIGVDARGTGQGQGALEDVGEAVAVGVRRPGRRRRRERPDKEQRRPGRAGRQAFVGSDRACAHRAAAGDPRECLGRPGRREPVVRFRQATRPVVPKATEQRVSRGTPRALARRGRAPRRPRPRLRAGAS